jgi:acyl-coenzyme A synthetase/AMP-(fatty) acid ligase
VVIASREVAMSGEALARLLGTSGATVLQATPATWRLLVDANFRGGPKFKALCGGEALPRELAGELLGRVGSLWNMYGPTETTIWSTCARIESIDGPITIGRPIANTTLHILDSEGSPVPLGAVGELHIGGVGVARGYLNRPDLTSERFVPDPFGSTPGARLYKTGDLARYDASGRVYFERRNDGQVKVRGFRIELGEIEAVFDQHPSVRQSACVIRQVAANDVRILAYVVSSDGKSPNVAELQQHARDHLAPYMIPQHVIALAEMPLTPNGKVDRKALPAPDLESLAAEQYVAPSTPTQVKLTAIWADVLRLRRVGIRDGFFELGGHSMLAVRMLNRVRETLGVVLPLRVAFQAQTVEALSAHVEAALLVGSRDASASAGNREEVDF